jgi:acetate kinase
MAVAAHAAVSSLDELVERTAEYGPARIAVVQGYDLDVLESLVEAERLGLAEAVLVGPRARIESAARQVGYALHPTSVVETAGEEDAIRASIRLVKEGKADLLMKGKVTTASLIRGVLDRDAGLRAGRLLSQVIVFEVPGTERLMLMTDAAVNIAPTLSDKADICRNAIEVAHAIGIECPNVVLLTALEFVNPQMPATVDAAALVQMNRRGQIQGAYLEGPLALDAPLSRFAAERKHRGGEHPLPRDHVLRRRQVRRNHRGRRRAAHPALARRAAGDEGPLDRARARVVPSPERLVRVLVPNLGSTSLKLQLLDMEDETVVARGRVSAIGSAGSAPDHRAAMGQLLEPVDGPIDAVGLKTVHGGPRFTESCLVTDEVVEAMREFLPVAPAHNAIYLEAIDILRDALPETPMVAVFEPGFHRTIPEAARLYGVPYEWAERHGIRRYGFHGASHRYVSQHVPERRLVSCHLGGSSSVCAILDGESVDTSFGFSPQSGVLQGNRCGDFDAFAVLHLLERMDAVELARALCKESGLLGISGVSGEMREVEEAAAAGNARAALAVDMFVHGVKKEIGAYAAVLGGIDALAFAGGIGENSPAVRERVCSGLEFLGIELDAARNRDPDATGGVVSPDGDSVVVVVVRTDEELVVARETVRVLGGVRTTKEVAR